VHGNVTDVTLGRHECTTNQQFLVKCADGKVGIAQALSHFFDENLRKGRKERTMKKEK
jgi:hypothetical protein